MTCGRNYRRVGGIETIAIKMFFRTQLFVREPKISFAISSRKREVVCDSCASWRQKWGIAVENDNRIYRL